MKKRLLFVFPLLFTFFGCSEETPVPTDLLTVHFETCTTKETNIVPDQQVEKGSLIDEPSVCFPFDDKSGLKITGWYKETTYLNKWDFLNDTVSQSMTLYAKWAETISITYYLKGSDTPIWTVSNAAAGEPLERHDELCDGYQFLGYFSDPDCVDPFDLTKPLNGDTTVYIKRSETMSYNATSIKRRYSMIAAGGTGSKAGNISAVQVGDDGVSYVDVNFGYSTTADPFMRTVNPQIDISKSQKIGLKFKNFGSAASMSFYWISKYANGDYASGIKYESEDNSYHVKLEQNEINMTEDSPWAEKVIDVSAKTTSGVSGWGNSVTLVSLRIQFEYISKNEHDLSNVIRFAEIYGVSDETHVGFNDSEEIKNLLHDDSESDLAQAKAKQTQNHGLIFPLNEDCVSSDSTTNYMKTDGVLLYSTYDTYINRFIFDLSGRHIDASEYSYLTLKIRNLSYVSSLGIDVRTISPTTGRIVSNNTRVTLSTRMPQKEEFSVNLYKQNNMVGIIDSIKLSFSVEGVDNAILVESITFSENRPFQIPGINFDDLKCAGFVSNSSISVSYNKTAKATTFISSYSSSISHQLDYDFDLISYENILLNFYYTSYGISSIKVVLDYGNNKFGNYLFSGFTISNELQTISLPLQEEGTIKEVKLEFVGAGRIEIFEIRFALNNENSCDLSSSSVFNSFLTDWAKPLSYVEDKEATVTNTNAELARYYFGYLFKEKRRQYGNICLENKSKIYLIYQNPKPTCNFFMDVYLVDKRNNSEYITSINELSPINLGQTFNIQMNMSSESWKVASISIPTQYRNENYYVSNIRFGIFGGTDFTLYLRGVVFK